MCHYELFPTGKKEKGDISFVIDTREASACVLSPKNKTIKFATYEFHYIIYGIKGINSMLLRERIAWVPQ